jgi:type II secretory pathway component PulJ
MMTNFGFQPGILDYWMLLTDWRNGSSAILLALSVLLFGYALRNKTLAAEALSPAEGISRQALSTSELGPAASLGDQNRALRSELCAASGDDEDGDVYGR